MQREIIEARQPFTKTFDLGTGELRMSIGQSPMHYLCRGRLLDIDKRPQKKGRFLLVDKAPYLLQIDPDRPAYRYCSAHRGQVATELICDVGTPPVVEERGVVWHEIADDSDYVVRPLGWGVATYLVLRSRRAPKRWRWRVDGNRDLLQPFVGTDALGRRIEIVQRYEGDHIDIEITGRATSQSVLRGAGKVHWESDLVYPLIIDPTVNEVVPSNADDAFSTWSSSGSVFSGFNSGLTYLQVGKYDAGGSYNYRYYAGVRFTTINIPNAASITSAVLTIDVTLEVGSPNVNVFGVASDNAAQFANPGTRIKNMTKTSASTNVTSPGTGTEAITVTSIVQEIVNRAGWVANNAMAFGFFNNSGAGGNQQFRFASLEHTTAAEAKLDITYSAGGGALPPFRRQTRFFTRRF
jgi:hypothetical protein